VGHPQALFSRVPAEKKRKNDFTEGRKKKEARSRVKLKEHSRLPKPKMRFVGGKPDDGNLKKKCAQRKKNLKTIGRGDGCRSIGSIMGLQQNGGWEKSFGP